MLHQCCMTDYLHKECGQKITMTTTKLKTPTERMYFWQKLLKNYLKLDIEERNPKYFHSQQEIKNDRLNMSSIYISLMKMKKNHPKVGKVSYSS